MGAINRLPTLAEMQAEHRTRPHWKSEVTRLDEKIASDKTDAKKLDEWRRAVVARDKGLCRVCGCRTLVTLALVPNRREIHHLRPRSCKVTRTDPRNGIVVCKAHHDQLTRHQLFVTQTAALMFTTGRGTTAKSYLNGEAALTFVSKRPDP